MSEEHDDASKTEDPTHKKLEEAKKKGQMPSTRELNHFFILLACIFFMTQMAPGMASRAMAKLSPFITRPESFEVDAASISIILRDSAMNLLSLAGMTLALTICAAIAPAMLQGKWVFAVEQIKPKFEKLNPIAGLKRLLGKKAIIEFVKNLFKIIIVGVTCVMLMMPYAHRLPSLLQIDSTYSLEFSGKMAAKLFTATCLFIFFLSIVDYLYQRFSFLKSMRMTKQEVKEEYRQSEGDPVQKQKLKQQRSERARRRMMSNVPKADVIITNPTHYAVALQYDSTKMAVPKVVAKGMDDVAARIRELAKEHRIMIVRNPPLARALYDTTEIDEEIPLAQYQAVAKIIGYVYKLKGKRPQQQAKPPSGKGYGRKTK